MRKLVTTIATACLAAGMFGTATLSAALADTSACTVSDGTFAPPPSGYLSYYSPDLSQPPVVSAELHLCGSPPPGAAYTLNGTFSDGATFSVGGVVGTDSFNNPVMRASYTTPYTPLAVTTTTGHGHNATTTTTYQQTNPTSACVYAVMSVTTTTALGTSATQQVSRYPSSGCTTVTYPTTPPSGYNW